MHTTEGSPLHAVPPPRARPASLVGALAAIVVMFARLTAALPRLQPSERLLAFALAYLHVTLVASATSGYVIGVTSAVAVFFVDAVHTFTVQERENLAPSSSASLPRLWAPRCLPSLASKPLGGRREGPHPHGRHVRLRRLPTRRAWRLAHAFDAELLYPTSLLKQQGTTDLLTVAMGLTPSSAHYSRISFSMTSSGLSTRRMSAASDIES